MLRAGAWCSGAALAALLPQEFQDGGQRNVGTLAVASALVFKHATVEALRSLEEPESVAKRRGLPVEDVAPAALLKARAEVSQ